MNRYRRGCGPVAEANTMDKAARDITRDENKVINFFMAETNQEKKHVLSSIYHTAKMFIKRWDGVSDDDKDATFAKDVVTVWTMLLNQTNGRKILIVPMGGVTVPDATYFGYWCTIRGITTAQLATIEIYVDKMRIRAEIPSATIDAITDISSASDQADDEGTAVAGEVAIEYDNEEDRDVSIVAERDNAPNIGNIVIDVNNGNVSMEEMVEIVAERTRQLLLSDNRKETENEIIDRPRSDSEASVTEVNRDVTASAIEPIETEADPPIELFQALNADSTMNESRKIGPIDQTMEDSGLAPPTTDSQVLPAPNVAIETLDGTGDDFETSSGWFDNMANDLIGRQQSTPSTGKITIDIDTTGYFVTGSAWTIACKLTKVSDMLKFVKNIVQGPPHNDWVAHYQDGERLRLFRKCYEFSSRNFPNFDFERLQNRNFENEAWCEIEPQNEPISLVRAKPTRKMLREIGRSNAIDEGTPIKNTPNTRNSRLHGRKGSRDQSFNSTASSTTIEPVELGLQMLRVQQRLNNIEEKLSKERNEKVKDMLFAMNE